jgi:hypothetical protein
VDKFFALDISSDWPAEVREHGNIDHDGEAGRDGGGEEGDIHVMVPFGW